MYCTASDGDYEPRTIPITFLAGQTTMNVPVRTIEDNVAELQERFEAELSNPREPSVILGQSRATVDILDNDGIIATVTANGVYRKEI